MKIMAKALSLLLALSMLPLAAGCNNGADSAASSKAASKKPTSSAVSSEAESQAAASASASSEPVIPTVNDYSTRTYNIPEIMSNLKINGRYAVTKAGSVANNADSITFDHTAQMISFNADCEGDVKLTMTVESPNVDGREGKYFLVVVDGVEKRMLAKGTKGKEVMLDLIIAEGLKRGKHTFEVYRQTEAIHGLCNMISITMNGVPTERPKNKDLYIEFLGDSITAGYGNLTTVEDEVQPSYPEKSSGTDTYAFLTAKALNADMSAVAQSGVAYAWGIGDRTIDDYWFKTSFLRSNLGNYKAERQPDIVVIGLGTNDHREYESKGFTDEQMTEAAVKLLKNVRQERPNAKIVWHYGILNNFLNKEIKKAVEEMGGAAKGFYYCETERRQDGGGWHPSKENHQAASEELVEFIKGIM